MKFACGSDLHGKLAGVKWPKADVLILAGDILPNFSYVKRSDSFMQSMWLEETFVPFAAKVLAKDVYEHIVFIPGNHDRLFQMDQELARNILNPLGDRFHLLIDEETTIDGKVIYGSPWTPWFGGDFWAFNLPNHNENHARARAHARSTWGNIPDDVEILITHGPVKGYLDDVHGRTTGCPYLLERMANLDKLQLHVCGHIHEGYGQAEYNPKPLSRKAIKLVNAALLNKPLNPVQVVEL